MAGPAITSPHHLLPLHLTRHARLTRMSPCAATSSWKGLERQGMRLRVLTMDSLTSLGTQTWIWGATGTQGCRRCWGNNPSLSIWARLGKGQSLLSQPWKSKDSWQHFPLQASRACQEVCRANPPCTEATLSFPKEISFICNF